MIQYNPPFSENAKLEYRWLLIMTTNPLPEHQLPVLQCLEPREGEFSLSFSVWYLIRIEFGNHKGRAKKNMRKEINILIFFFSFQHFLVKLKNFSPAFLSIPINNYVPSPLLSFFLKKIQRKVIALSLKLSPFLSLSFILFSFHRFQT